MCEGYGESLCDGQPMHSRKVTSIRRGTCRQKPSASENKLASRAEFLRSLRARGLGGVRLVISDAHTGLKAAIARVFEATWQRCRVH